MNEKGEDASAAWKTEILWSHRGIAPEYIDDGDSRGI